MRFRSSFSLIMLLCLALLFGISLAAQGGPRPLDLVLLLDESGSMDKTDPTGARREAAHLFAMLCGAGQRVGLVGFASEARDLAEPKIMGPGENQTRLFKQIGAIQSGGQYTNIENAIRRARDQILMLDGQGTKRRRAILLLTDGKVDLGDSAADSASLQSIIGPLSADLIDKGIEVYCVAYSAQADREMLDYLAKSTGGMCVRGDNSKELQKLFVRLFEELAQPQTVPLQGNQAMLDSDVREATFLVAHPEVAAKVQLTRPDGSKSDSQHPGESTKWFAAAGYDLVTVTQPMPGGWRIEPLPDGENSRVMILTNLELDVEKAPESLLAGEEGVVAAKLVSNNKTLQAPEIFQSLKVQATIRSSSVGSPSQTWSLHDDGKSGDGAALDGTLAGLVEGPGEGGSYDLEIIAQAPTFQRRALRKISVSRRWFQVQMDKDMIRPGEAVGLRALVSPLKPWPTEAMQFHVAVSCPNGSSVTRTMQSKDKGQTFSLALGDLKEPGNYQISVTGSIGKDQRKVSQSTIGPLDLTVKGNPASPLVIALPPPESKPAANQFPADLKISKRGAMAPRHSATAAASTAMPGVVLWVLAGILAALVVIAAQLSVLIARKPTVTANEEPQMEQPQDRAPEILRPVEPPLPRANGRIGGGKISEKLAQTATRSASASNPIKPEIAPADSKRSNFKPEVLVTVADDDSSSPARENANQPQPSSETPPSAGAEIIENLTEDEESLLAEIMSESAASRKPTGEEPSAPMEEASASEKPVEFAEPPGSTAQNPAPPKAERNLSDEDKNLLAGISGESNEMEEQEEGKTDLLAELDSAVSSSPSIPDENDERSDQDIIDDILNQIEGVKK